MNTKKKQSEKPRPELRDLKPKKNPKGGVGGGTGTGSPHPIGPGPGG